MISGASRCRSAFKRMLTALRKTVAPVLIAATIVAAVNWGRPVWHEYQRSRRISAAREVGTSGESPVRVTGRVLLGAEPRERLHVQLFARDGQRASVAWTDQRGEFRLAAPSAGEYGLVIGTLETLPSTHRYYTLVDGDNRVEVSLPATRIEVTLVTSEGKSQPLYEMSTQLTIHGPLAPTSSTGSGFIGRKRQKKAIYVGLGFGTYEVTGSTSGGLVSTSVARVMLSEEHPIGTVELPVSRRPLRVRLQDDAGAVVRVASARVGARVLTSGADGSIDADEVPGGARLLLSAVGFVPMCVLALSQEGVQIVNAIKRGAGRARITLVNGPNSPVGLLEGLPGSDCGVGVSAFRLNELPPTALGEVAFEITGLPRGEYQYRAEEQAPHIAVSVPGEDIRYLVPSFCRFCNQ